MFTSSRIINFGPFVFICELIFQQSTCLCLNYSSTQERMLSKCSYGTFTTFYITLIKIILTNLKYVHFWKNQDDTCSNLLYFFNAFYHTKQVKNVYGCIATKQLHTSFFFRPGGASYKKLSPSLAFSSPNRAL